MNKNKNEKFAAEMMDYYNKAFKHNKVNAECVNYVIGNTTTRIYVNVLDKKHIKYVEMLVPQVSAAMKNYPMHFVKKIPGSKYSVIEIMNQGRDYIDFKEQLEKLPDASACPTAFALGKTVEGEEYFTEIRKLHHILISGTKLSGKTNLINNLLSTVIKRTSPTDARLVLIDPTHFEINPYKDDPHLLCPIVVDPITCKEVLIEMVDIMNRRYQLFEECGYHKNIEEYNAWAKENNKEGLPYIIVVLNEHSMFSIMGKVSNIPLVSLLQKAWASGIHVIISTEIMSPRIMTPVIMANLATKIALNTSNALDSIQILGEEGAEKIIPNSGDILIKSKEICKEGILKLSTPYISSEEIYEIVKESKDKYELSYDKDLLKITEINTSTEMKKLFLELDTINEENEERVGLWAFEQEIITLDKIKNELAVSLEQANQYLNMLINRGIILKTDNPHIYKVIED